MGLGRTRLNYEKITGKMVETNVELIEKKEGQIQEETRATYVLHVAGNKSL